MIKRRKDGGFTLIELMIVIAVIGILAVVLVPKMAGVKDSAKVTGVETNKKSVQAYILTNYEKWFRDSSTNANNIADAIENYFEAPDNELTNPFTSSKDVMKSTLTSPSPAVFVKTNSSVTPTKGIIVVDLYNWRANGISITGYDGEDAPSEVGEGFVIKP